VTSARRVPAESPVTGCAGASRCLERELQHEPEQRTAGGKAEQRVRITDGRRIPIGTDVSQRLEAEEDEDDRPGEADQQDRKKDLQPAIGDPLRRRERLRRKTDRPDKDEESLNSR